MTAKDSFNTVYANNHRFTYDLSVNINPLGPSPQVLEICKTYDEMPIYPGASYKKLQETLSLFFGIHPETILLGAGIDGLLHDFILQFLKNHQKLLMPAVTFQNPSFSARLAGGIVEKIPMLPDLKVDFSLLHQKLTDEVSIIFLCQPNNPTGLLEDRKDLIALLNATNALVIVDEANIEYTSEQSCIELVDHFPNLVVMRSFSKAYSLAGMRVGYAVASPCIQSEIMRNRPPFNVSGLSCAMARAAQLDQGHLKYCVDYIKQEKKWLGHHLEGLGCLVLPSDSNTLFVMPPKHITMSVSELILMLNVLDCHVVDGAHFGPVSRYFRVVPNLTNINQKFVEILKSILNRTNDSVKTDKFIGIRSIK